MSRSRRFFYQALTQSNKASLANRCPIITSPSSFKHSGVRSLLFDHGGVRSLSFDHSGVRSLSFDHGGIATEKLFTDQKHSERYSKYRPGLPQEVDYSIKQSNFIIQFILE